MRSSCLAIAALVACCHLVAVEASPQAIQVDGIVESTAGGFKFPDDTVQMTAATGAGTSYANVVVVAKSGGDFTTITDALNSISDADATNPYLVWMAPGVYPERVVMKEWVDIRGAGPNATRITASAGDFSTPLPTVTCASNSALANLTVENTGGDLQALGVYCDGESGMRFHDLKVIATGSTGMGFNSTTGIQLRSAEAVLHDLEVIVTATAETDFVSGLSFDGSAASSNNVVRDSIIEVSGLGDGSGSGVAANGTFVAQGLLIDVSGVDYASGAGCDSCLSGAFHDCRIDVEGDIEVTGVGTFESVVEVVNSVVSATGGSTSSYGVSSSAPVASAVTPTVTVTNSQIAATDATVRSASGVTTSVGASLLDGGAADANSGTLVCAGVFDESFTFSPSSCP